MTRPKDSSPISMSNKLYGLLAMSAALVFSCSCARSEDVSTPTPIASAPVALTATGRPVAWKFQNEQEWIVDTVGRDIAEILAYASAHKKSDSKFSTDKVEFKTETIDLHAGVYNYTYSLPSAKASADYKFTLKDYIWNPDSYEPLAAKIITQLALAPDSMSKPPQGFLLKLANADMGILIEENQRISTALSSRPLDAGLHEQAALLVTAFDRQDMAGRFCDVRQNLNRLATHLTLAKALNKGQLGVVGKLADIALECSACRMTVAMDKMAAMKKTSTEADVAAWLRAHEIFATGDYRIFDSKNHTAMEEQLYALYSALYNQDGSIMVYVEEHYPKLPVEWRRLVGNTNCSVQSGHVVLNGIVGAEVNAYLADYAKYIKPRPDKEITEPAVKLEQLNLPPARCASQTAGEGLQVLAWNNVAAFHARHILNAINMEYNFYQKMYGDKERAKAFLAQVQKDFSKLDQYPFVETRFALEPAQKAEFFRRAQEMVVNHPERVTAESWNLVNDCVKHSETKPPLVSEGLWFDPVVPMGTAFDFQSRKLLTNYKDDLVELTRLKTLCPYTKSLVTEWVLKKYGKNATADDYLKAYGNLIDYVPSTRAVAADAAIKEPDKYIAIQAEAAKKQPFRYFDLGSYCVLHNRPEQAAKFFEEGVKTSRDDVLTANKCDWLIRYKFDHGQKEEAEKLAMFAGEVYSSAGLESQARYYERVGEIKKAEETLRANAARYEDGGQSPLAAFLIRHANKDLRYKAESDKLVAEIFPEGLQKVQLGDFNTPPTDGVLITAGDKLWPESLLVKDAVIVAVNGYRVHSKPQFHVARNMPNSEFLTAIAWDGKHYIEIHKPIVNGNFFGVSIADYKH